MKKVGKTMVNTIDVSFESNMNNDSSSYGDDMNFMDIDNEKVNPDDLPSFLQRALLNCHITDQESDQLPIPHSVMLNHVYTRKSEMDNNVLILGVSMGYQQKVSTIVYYTKNEGTDDEFL